MFNRYLIYFKHFWEFSLYWTKKLNKQLAEPALWIAHLALVMEPNRTTGPRVIPSATMRLFTPDCSRALAPRLVEATRQPSVVAIGTCIIRPSSSRGPATPTGTGTYPITFSQHVPSTWKTQRAIFDNEGSQGSNILDLYDWVSANLWATTARRSDRLLLVYVFLHIAFLD